MPVIFEQVARSYWNNLDSLREYTSLVRPVAQKKELDRTIEFLETINLAGGTLKDEEGREEDNLRGFIEFMKNMPHDRVAAAVERTFERADQGQAIEVPFSIEIPEGRVAEAYHTLMDLMMKASSVTLLHRSVIISLVSFFEVLLADCVHRFYTIRPKALSGDDKVLSFNELSQFESLEAAIEHIRSRRVEELLRGSLQDWSKFLDKHLNIDFQHIPPVSWGEWAEVFLRRNLLVHNDGKVNLL